MPGEQQKFEYELNWEEIYGEVVAPDTGTFTRPAHPDLAKWLLKHSEPFASINNAGPVHTQSDSVGDILPWWGNKPVTTRREQREINMRGIKQARAILESVIDRANMPKQLDLPTGDSAA